MKPEENNEIWEKLQHKKNIYQVPDDYFEKLPQIIQSKAVQPSRTKERGFVYALRYAVPVVLIVMVALITLINRPDNTSGIEGVQGALSEVSTEDLIQFLSESDITVDEILAEVDMSVVEFEFEEEETDLFDSESITSEELDELLDEFTESPDFL